MRALITGAGGTIGAEIARQCGERGWDVCMVDRSEAALYAAAGTTVNAMLVVADVANYGSIERAAARFRPKVVFHCAAHKHVPMMEDNPYEATVNNVLGTQNTLDAAMSADRFVLISTDKAVEPSCVMGATKFLAERVAKAHADRLAVAVVRFGNVRMSSGSVLETWDRQASRGGPITLTDPEMTRYFIDLADAARFAVDVAEVHRSGFGVFVPDMGRPVRMGDLAETFALARGVSVKVVGRRNGEKRHEKLHWPDEQILRPEVCPA